MTDLRVYLAGRVTVEHGDRILSEDGLPRRQGKLAFVFLALERHRPVSRDELAEAIWGDRLPGSRDVSLSALVSKLRSALGRAGLKGSDVLRTAAGCYELRLPGGTFVDLETAAESLHEAEGLLRSGASRESYVPGSISLNIAKRPFLPGEDAPWVDRVRSRLQDIRLRSLEVCMWAHLQIGDAALAAARAEDALELEPFRESLYQGLMRAHAAAGNRAEALRAYERCRKLLAEELGVDPSQETRAQHATLLSGDETTARPAPAAPAPGPVAIVFTDITGSTEQLERLGDDEADRRLRRHFELTRELASAHNGTVVKTLGDGAMLVFRSAVDSVRFGAAFRDAAADLESPVRVGIHFGEPVLSRDDVFGLPVVIARRLCDRAGTGRVVVSDLIRGLVASRSGVHLADIGALALKGVSEPVRAWELVSVDEETERLPFPRPPG